MILNTCFEFIYYYYYKTHVAMAGDFESGKSTLIGVLAGGTLDNGKGLARMQIFTHNHEVHSGRTSSVSQHNIYFDKNGFVLNAEKEGAAHSSSNQLHGRTESELADASTRILTFIDMAGHRYVYYYYYCYWQIIFLNLNHFL